MFTIIISIAITIIMLAYFCRMLNLLTKFKPWFTEFLVIALCLLALTLLNPDTAVNANAISEAYDRGFNDAIITAELVDVYDSGYTIAFGEDIPEVHHYTSDGSHLVPIKDVSEK